MQHWKKTLLKTCFRSCLVWAFLSAGQSSVAAADLHGWFGTWTKGDNKIRLSLRKGQIHAEGEAYYYPYKNSPSPNIGEFEGSSLPKHGRLTIRQHYNGELVCEVIMVRSDNTLTVLNHDPNCGGHNVSFRGTYHRQGRHR
ncbi:MAG TPA: hypothetical protein VKB94_01560 [Rhizomicrobium sp.]|nr:hypothetical protein [Rhizomicrobium sp.]